MLLFAHGEGFSVSLVQVDNNVSRTKSILQVIQSIWTHDFDAYIHDFALTRQLNRMIEAVGGLDPLVKLLWFGHGLG